MDRKEQILAVKFRFYLENPFPKKPVKSLIWIDWLSSIFDFQFLDHTENTIVEAVIDTTQKSNIVFMGRVSN